MLGEAPAILAWMADRGDSTGEPPPGFRKRSAADRLWALETSGDPDARAIARGYRVSALNPTTPIIRETARALRRTTEMFAPTYERATDADADEAELAYATLRAEREQTSRAREQELFDFAVAADRRERKMLTLTKTSVAVALVSLLISGAALIIALATMD